MIMLICITLHGCLHSTDETVIHSLCPALGKMHALIFKGMCPFHLQNPLGREINIVFGYAPPFSIPSPHGGGIGSDFLVMQMLARKNGFIPRFIYETDITAQLSSVSWNLFLLRPICTVPFYTS